MKQIDFAGGFHTAKAEPQGERFSGLSTGKSDDLPNWFSRCSPSSGWTGRWKVCRDNWPTSKSEYPKRADDV